MPDVGGEISYENLNDYPNFDEYLKKASSANVKLEDYLVNLDKGRDGIYVPPDVWSKENALAWLRYLTVGNLKEGGVIKAQKGIVIKLSSEDDRTKYINKL